MWGSAAWPWFVAVGLSFPGFSKFPPALDRLEVWYAPNTELAPSTEWFFPELVTPQPDIKILQMINGVNNADSPSNRWNQRYLSAGSEHMDDTGRLTVNKRCKLSTYVYGVGCNCQYSRLHFCKGNKRWHINQGEGTLIYHRVILQKRKWFDMLPHWKAAFSILLTM